MPFQNLNEFIDLLAQQPSVDENAVKDARERNAQLTKPPGALGRLEELAIWYCGWRGDPRAQIRAPQITIFAGNHGITARGVSAFPSEVTAQMVANFQNGGAAINQLAHAAGARLDVIALALETPVRDFTTGAAMSEAEVVAALRAGWESVAPTADLLVAGEMGIGNTTAAAAIACALFGGQAADWAGRGTGVDDAGLDRKRQVIAEGLARNPDRAPLEVLRCLGGREIAAMAGAIARARSLKIPVILDGAICLASAAVLAKVQDGAIDHCVAGHRSAEPSHDKMLQALGLVPLLDLGLRLGEGSGGALAIAVVKAALACHSGMATFAEASVSGAN